MINTLVSLNADLASSIALRYACRLTEFNDMHLQTIHVEELEKEGYPPGSGWVRSTWEKGLLRTAKEEISQLINTDKSSCPTLDPSIVRIGDREEELLWEIENQPYDLLLEGVLSSYDAQLFHQKIRSKLYKYVPCPIILVKNLVKPDRMALLFGDLNDVKPLVSAFLKLFAKSKLSVDLIYYIVNKTDQGEFKVPIKEATTPGAEDADRVIGEARALLAEHDWTPQASWIVQGRPKKIGEILGEYGLVGARVPHATNRKNIVINLLSRVPSATLLCK